MPHATDPDTSDRDIVLSRSFAAPRELVWAAWTDPAQVSAWWGPDGFSTTTHRIDIRPGGMWIYDMHGPDGTTYPNRMRHLIVDPPRQLVYDHAGGSGDLAEVQFRVAVDFTEADGRTTVTMRHVFPTAAARDLVVQRYGAIEGGKQHLARLEAYAARAASATFATAREIPAPAEQVFAAICDPVRLARWWGPAGFTNTFTVCEVVPGGRWSLVMHGPDGQDYPNENEFADIVPSRLVVIRHPGQPRFQLSLALDATPAGTLVRWIQTFADPAMAGRVASIVMPANEQNLDRLADEVLRRPTGG